MKRWIFPQEDLPPGSEGPEEDAFVHYIATWKRLSCLQSSTAFQDVTFKVLADDKNDTVKEFVCYGELGCFHRNGTFEHLAHLPDPPEYIGTKYLQYPDAVELDQDSPQLLKPGRPLFILIHGFNQDSNSHRFVEMKNALLKRDPDTNVVIVDWWKGARGPFYFSAAVNAEVVGRQTGRLLSLLSTSVDLENDVHVVGFSLGAQISGFTGRWLRSRYGKMVGRITGLDPASPFYEGYGPDVHLTTADAKFVDVIHTSAGDSLTSGEVGFIAPVGHVDFYPNGGRGQPHCVGRSVIHIVTVGFIVGHFTMRKLALLMMVVSSLMERGVTLPHGGIKCNHEASLMFFIQSINSSCNFKAYPCPGGYKAFTRGHCFNCKTNGPCGEMGITSVKEQGRGTLYLPTRVNLPVCGR
ncbi:Lipase [Cordylochernes scorpioides]|uniref:Lipase n=1 Tax=Cordylochernes scorpioides TaxID=51811 RepID=A0ABY6LR45_9ARAC|nr:Lipase [Cordylochernes scorpioides]